MRALLFVLVALRSIACDTNGKLDETARVRRRSEQQHLLENPDSLQFFPRRHDPNGDSSRFGAETVSERHSSTEAVSPERGKVYEPREDPAEYYKSAGYIERMVGCGAAVRVREMSSVFPRLEPRLARSRQKAERLRYLDRSRYKDWNSVSDFDDDLCVRCPADRTLVIRQGVDKVLFQAPRLRTCSGEKAPPGARLLVARGPRYGVLLASGAYVVEGRIAYKGQYLERCRMTVSVVPRLCKIGRELRAACDGIRCNFTCSDRSLKLHGSRTLICGSDLRWSGALPVCRDATWCEMPPPPDHGTLSCESARARAGLAEGSRCRASCEAGWRAAPRTSVCRRGRWSARLACKRRPALRARAVAALIRLTKFSNGIMGPFLSF